MGKISSKGPLFYEIIIFNNTNSEKLSFLSKSIDVYKDAHEIKRTMWLIK